MSMPSAPPCEPRRTEVLLKRLLLCCEQAAVSSGGADWARSPQAQFDVDAAQDLVTQLTAAGASNSLLAGFAQRTQALRAALRPSRRPAYLRAPVARMQFADAAPRLATGGTEAAAPGLRRRPAPGGAGGGSAALDAQAALHEEITTELVDMSAQLKRNAYAMHAAVRDSARLLDDVGASVERNLASTTRATDKAKAIYQVNRASCWVQCAVFAAITLVFCWMVMLIRMNKNRLKPMLATMPAT